MIGYKLTLHLHLHLHLHYTYTYSYAHDNNISASQIQKRLENIKRLPCKNFECLWCEIQQDNAKYFVAVLYHPPNPNYPECELLEYLSDKCEEILFLDSPAIINKLIRLNQIRSDEIMRKQEI